MNRVLKIITFSMLGLLVSNNQLVHAMSQTAQMNTEMELFMEIKEFFMGLSKDLFDINIDCSGGSARQPQGKMIASFKNPQYTGMGIGSGRECKVFFMDHNLIPVAPERTNNVVALRKQQMMSQQEKNILMEIHDFFMTLKNSGKIMIVSQAGTKLPNEEPIAQYANPNYMMKAKGKMTSGGARQEILIYATPFHTMELLGTEEQPVKLRRPTNNYASDFFTNSPPYRSMSQPNASRSMSQPSALSVQ